MKNKELFMLGLCLMAVSLSGCIIIADNSPKRTHIHVSSSADAPPAKAQ